MVLDLGARFLGFKVRRLARTANSVNNTVCLTATLIGMRVVVGGWKSLVFTIQIRKPR